MKLNEFKQLNELDLSHAFGDYGAATFQQLGNRLNPFNKTGSDQLSVQDKMAKNIFISNMIGRASADLDSAIKGGLVDPKLKTGQAPTTQPTTAQQPPAQQPPAQQPPAGETPEQKRIRMQKAAQQNIDKTANPFSKLPANQPTTQAGNIRQAKQKVASANAQSQMAPFSKLPANQTNVQAGNIRQAKQKTAGANAQSQMAPVSKLPANQTAIQAANIRKAKQAAAQANLFKESTYAKLDYILESVININEEVAAPKQSISDFIQRFFKKYLKVQTIPPQVQTQVTALANEIQNTYPRNKDALTKLANLGYAFSYSDQDTTADTTAGATQPATNSFAAGIQQALGKGASASSTTVDTTTPATANTQGGTTPTGPATTANPQQEKTVYAQVKGMLDKLDKKGKQRILAALQKSLGDTTATKAPVTDPGANAFAQMGKQVTQTGVTNPAPATKTSTGGKVQNTGLGLVNTKSRNNPNIKRRPRVNAQPTTQVPTDNALANRQQKLATRKQKAPA